MQLITTLTAQPSKLLNELTFKSLNVNVKECNCQHTHIVYVLLLNNLNKAFDFRTSQNETNVFS